MSTVGSLNQNGHEVTAAPGDSTAPASSGLVTPDPVASASSSPIAAASAAATETLLNCYVRETRSGHVDGETFVIPLPESGVELRAKLRHRSLTGRHRYELPVDVVVGDRRSPVGFTALAGLLLDALEALDGSDAPGTSILPGSGASTALAARMLESLHTVAGFLQHRRADIDRLWSAEPLGFLESEQALLLGHPLHPTPKSRDPMAPHDRARYSPETGGRFPLRWLAVAPDAARHASATGMPAPVHSRELAARCGVPGPDELRELTGRPESVLLPAHPWELAHLRDHPETADLFETGTVVDLGAFGSPVGPTTSVRTVYRADWPWQLKFSLHVRVTNSERVTLPKELDRAVEAARLWQTEVGAAAARIAPAFACIHDPAHLTVVRDGQVVNGFSVLLRENPWITRNTGNGSHRDAATAPDVSSLTSLCQDHPFGGPSRLARIVHRRACRERRPAAEVGREWFARFLDVAVVSLVRLYLDLGLCFEPHQQNTLLELDGDGQPERCLYRDSQGYFHRELAHDDLCRAVPQLGEATESIFPEALADERLVYYPFVNLTLGVVDALGVGGCGDEALLLADLRRCLEAERASGGRYPPTLLDRLLDASGWPCKANLRTRLHDMDELVGDIASQSVYVTIPNPLLAGEASPVDGGPAAQDST